MRTKWTSPEDPPTLVTPANLLDQIEITPRHVPLRFGEIEIDESAGVELVRVRSARGELQIELTEDGPRIRLEGVDIEIAAHRKLSLSGEEVALRATREMTVECGGAMRTRVRGDRHTRVGGHERFEASFVEMQANEGHFAIRARDDVRIDGEHVGLNSEDALEAFSWSTPMEEP